MEEERIFAIRESIRTKYRRHSALEQGLFSYSTGKAGLLELGYKKDWVDSLPDEIARYYCGVGNPFGAGPVRKGEYVLDVGCGAGVDLIFAASLAGETGAAYGIDLSEEMTDKARNHLSLTGHCAQVTSGLAENLPFPDDFFDIVISNGVINLSPEKKSVFSEIYRVLKNKGRLQFADIVLDSTLPVTEVSGLQAWSN